MPNKYITLENLATFKENIEAEFPQETQVLELNSSSGTLTDAQYELASSNNCILKYNEQYYFKSKETSSTIMYDNLRQIVGAAPDSYIKFTVIQCSISKSSKTWGFATNASDTVLSVVKANPTLSGNESELNGLEVLGTKYKIAPAINPTSLAEPYDNTATYAINDYCIYNGTLYRCNTAIATGGETWDSTHWTACQVMDEIANAGGIQVIEISSATGTLSASDLAKINANPSGCVIQHTKAWGGELYTLRMKMSGVYYYCNWNGNNNGSYAKDVQINDTTGAYTTNSQSFSVEANPTIPSGTTVNSLSNLKVGTSYYSVGGTPEVLAYEGAVDLPNDIVFNNNAFHRMIKDGNTLWIFIHGRIQNNSNESKSFKDICHITIPSSIAALIYRVDGTTCEQNCGSDNLVMLGSGMWSTSSRAYMVRSYTANEFYIDAGTSITLTANESRPIDIRIPIFLDIGTVQTVSNT